MTVKLPQKSRLPGLTVRLSGCPDQVLQKLAAAAAIVAFGALIGQLLIVWVTLRSTSQSSVISLLGGMLLAVAGHFFADYCSQRRLNQPAGDKNQGLRSHRIFFLSSAAVLLLSWSLPAILLYSLHAGQTAADIAQSVVALPSTASQWLTMVPSVLAVAGILSVGFLWTLAFSKSAEAIASNQAACSSSVRDMSRTVNSSMMLAAAFGMCCLLVHAVWSVPLAMTVTLLSAAAVLMETAWRFNGSGPDTVRTNDFETRNRPIATIASTVAVPRCGSRWRADRLTTCFGSGTAIVAVCWIMTQLIPASVPLAMLSVVTLTAVLKLISTLSRKRLLPSVAVQPAALLILCSLPLLFTCLTNWNLSLQTSIQVPLVLMGMQSLQCGVFLAAALMPLMLSHSSEFHASSGEDSLRVTDGGAILCVCGIISGLLLISSAVTARGLLLIAVCLIIVPQLLRDLFALRRNRTAASAGMGAVSISKMLITAGTLVKCLSMIAISSPDTSRSAQLLFTERSHAAVRLGMDAELIPQSDAGRLLASVQTADGQVHTWHRTGAIVEFRRNGISLGQVSSDTDLTPQPPEEIMPVVLPLVMHPSPERVLILGDETGVCLRTCSHFPVERIVAVRGDHRVTQLAEQYTWSGQEISPTADDRVTLRHESPADMLRQSPELPYDIIVSSLPPATTAAGVFGCSTEFYRSARKQLAADGVFCQRFRMHGLGPDPLMKMMATAMQSFHHVLVVQTVPGEVLLIAANTDAKLPDQQTLKRMQLDYIRREIGTADWDWSRVAVLPMLEAGDSMGLFSHQTLPSPFSAADGHLTLALPFEVLSRKDRTAEMLAAVAPHQLQICERIPTGELHHEIQRRLSALAQQSEILAGMPDEPWTYRKSLRVEMQRNPRPPRDIIQDGVAVRTSHPADQLRQDYFVELGQSIQRVKGGARTYDAFSGLASFTVPYEPLVSLFAHYEIVRLHEIALHPAPVTEFRQRMHTVYFTEPSDASVRPVISAMQQLMEHPEVLNSDSERFDQLNSLVQKLIERWEARTRWEPRSARRVQNDVDQSVAVTNRALEKLEQWSRAASQSSEELVRRRRFITEALITPLRNYRDQVLAHMIRTQPTNDLQVSDASELPLLADPEAVLNTN